MGLIVLKCCSRDCVWGGVTGQLTHSLSKWGECKVWYELI